MPSTEFLHRPGSVWERTKFEGKAFPQIREEMEQLAIDGLRTYDDVTWHPGTCGTISGKWIRPVSVPGLAALGEFRKAHGI